MRDKLRLDPAQIARARTAATRIATDLDSFIAKRTTVAVERTVLRLMGVDGVDSEGVPLPNVVVDHLLQKGELEKGAAFWTVNAGVQYGLTPQQVAERVASGSLDLTSVSRSDGETLRREGNRLAVAGLNRIAANRKEREDRIRRWGEGGSPISM